MKLLEASPCLKCECLAQRIATLEAENARLQQQLAAARKDSSTSSKPPSSDVKFLLTLPGREVQAYGQRLRDALRDLFGVIHRREKMTATGFQKALEAARERVLKAATTRVPDAKHARNLAKRFRENGKAYFRFIILSHLSRLLPS